MNRGQDHADTSPELGVWPATNRRFRRSEVSAVIGSGDEAWRRATDGVLRWEVKTRSGFTVDDDARVEAGRRLRITAAVAGITVVEPVEVVGVVERPDRVGFAYRTLPGHPVDGEEAFVVHRTGAVVRLTVRSLTRPAEQQPWRTLYPLLRIAQLVARRRYLRALRRP
ncbi:hypothetical protein GCM10025867_44460 [Frondihabitans sucicola]|uniref:DUF1990 domain-containing protein n=1 Tax=Frondihabitans sucicola TaxID=1268041 RepID=A0ABM8GUQ0_9MICO|nr:DUF1990 family protein [Frondihabitans sucicola]BDZ52205.1 hypothetical protein GCM10025867_44460 [Frondihabitans sucicola]